MKINFATNKNNLIKIGFGILALLTLTMAAYLIFMLRDISSVSAEIYQARVEMEKKYQTGISLKKNNQQLGELEARLIDLDESIIKYEQNLEFINDLEKEAENLGLQLNLQIPEISPTETITAGIIQLTLVGNPDAALKFLEVLDAKNYYLHFNTLRLTNAGLAAAQKNNYSTLFLDGKIYWQ